VTMVMPMIDGIAMAPDGTQHGGRSSWCQSRLCDTRIILRDPGSKARGGAGARQREPRAVPQNIGRERKLAKATSGDHPGSDATLIAILCGSIDRPADAQHRIVG
jgi:hypothetical protein